MRCLSLPPRSLPWGVPPLRELTGRSSGLLFSSRKSSRDWPDALAEDDPIRDLSSAFLKSMSSASQLPDVRWCENGGSFRNVSIHVGRSLGGGHLR